MKLSSLRRWWQSHEEPISDRIPVAKVLIRHGNNADQFEYESRRICISMVQVDGHRKRFLGQ